MRSLILVIGFFLAISMSTPQIRDEDYMRQSVWDEMIDSLNQTFPNNDELIIAKALMSDESWPDLNAVGSKNQFNPNIDKLIGDLMIDDPSKYRPLQTSYEKKKTAYQSLSEREKKLFNELFAIVLPRFIGYIRHGKGIILTDDEARRWKKTFGTLTNQEKDSFRSKFPLLTYVVRSSGKIEDMEAEKTEADLSQILEDEARSGLFYQIVNEAKNSSDPQKLLDVLKTKNMKVYNQVKPLIEKLHKAYQSLPEKSKALVLQSFEWIFENRNAFKEENYDHFLTEDQIKQLKKRYYSLPRDEQRLVETSFPHFIRSLKAYFELSIAKAFNRNR